MKRNLKKLAALLLAASLMLLAGCQNQPVLSRRLLIRGIGVDVLEDGGYLASIHVMDVRSKESDKVDLWKSEGESVMEALNHVTMQVGDAPLYSQNLIIIFGRGCVCLLYTSPYPFERQLPAGRRLPAARQGRDEF